MPYFKNYSEKSELEDNDISILSELNGKTKNSVSEICGISFLPVLKVKLSNR